MSQNLLVERLKNAKRELTALKTAHRRGLGLLKVYNEEYTATAPSAQTYWLTIDVEFEGLAYPFVQLYTKDEIATAPIIANQEFEYKNTGKNAEFRFTWLDEKLDYNFVVYSTSPIKSVRYEWARYE